MFLHNSSSFRLFFLYLHIHLHSTTKENMHSLDVPDSSSDSGCETNYDESERFIMDREMEDFLRIALNSNVSVKLERLSDEQVDRLVNASKYGKNGEKGKMKSSS